MFRKQRRKEKEISKEKIVKLLQNERRAVIAVNGDDGYPYCVPINYLYDAIEEKVYFHGSKAGHKTESIIKNDRVCLVVYGNETIKEEEKWAPYLESAVVFGRCHIIKEKQRALSVLKKLALKYYPDIESVIEEIEKDGKRAELFEVEIEHISGKRIQEK